MSNSIRRIDIHTHGFPEAYLRQMAKYYPNDVEISKLEGTDKLVAYWSKAPLPAWNLKERIEQMDRDGVTTEVLFAPPVYSYLDENTAEFCRILNDFQAEMYQLASGRFRSFLHLPVHDYDATMQELERWKGQPEVAGVLFGSNMQGIYPGQVSLSIWEAIYKAGLSVFVHPLPPPASYGPIMPVILMFPGDTATAAASVIYAGIFDRFPGIKVILAHLGGSLTFLAKRLDMAIDIPGFPKKHGQELSKLPSDYLEHFYLDLGQGFHQPSFECACSVVGIKHILYGSDHFFIGSSWRSKLNDFLDNLSLSNSDQEAILWKNAQRVLL
ncbi:MAG: amidohydrolase [Symploca sp. SIO1B1]|nr:amidohydrolase [Symploca sp. SIO2D2]NER96360.1 amidohydrolase [Symploca sp. SIO1B1]